MGYNRPPANDPVSRMARITVEDCLEQIDNRFDLVLVAARRARALKLGRPALLSWDDDKATVLALREIAAGKVDREILDQPLMPPSEEDQQGVEEIHRLAAEMKVDDLSAAQDDEDDFDEDDFDEELEAAAAESGDAPADAAAAPEAAEAAQEPDAPDG